MDVRESDGTGGTGLSGYSRKSYDAFISYAHEADRVFAATLQRSLQQLAKPWNRRRVMDVFRDDTSLAASPGLWPSIRAALDASRWFILLASPEAARSSWVGEEIKYWVSNKGTDHLLVVVTGGTWVWDNGSGDLDIKSTAANRALLGAFPAEPKYVDMTWASRDTHLTLRNARFRDQIATLAAAIREVPKEEIEGEDVRQQRRTRRIVRSVIAVLTVLVLLASVLAISFNFERLQAIHQSQEAIRQRDIAVSGQMISQSELLRDTNPVLSRLLSIAAWRIHPSSDSRYAMMAAAAYPGIAVLTGHAGVVHSVAFSPNGKILASGGEDSTVRLWDVATGQQIGRPLTARIGGSVRDVESVAFSPDGKTLATGNGDGTVRLWDVATSRQIGGPLVALTAPVESVAFSPDGRTLVSGGPNDTVQLWKVATRRQIGGPLWNAPNAANDVWSVAFSPDGKTIASGGGGALSDGTVRLWDAATRRPIGRPLADASDFFTSVTFSPDGRTLAIGCLNGTVRLLDVATGRQIGSPITAPIGTVNAVAFSPDGKTLASGSADGTVRLWDVATGQQIGSTLAGHTGFVAAVAFSRDGKTLASGGGDGTVRLWDVATGQQIRSTLTDTAFVAAVAFSPDGKTLASGSEDNAVRLSDAATGRQIGSLVAVGGVFSLAFSPDGKTLASGNGNGTVRLWDMATRRQVGNPLGFAGPSTSLMVNSIQSVAFSPDGKTLATGGSGSADGAVRLWDVATHREMGSPLGSADSGLMRWRSARTARPWPAAVTMAWCGCGT